VRRTFPLEIERLKPPRVIESIKNEVRKYLKRERKKTLPEGVDFWDFDCRAGQDSNSAEPLHVAELNTTIDTASRENWKTVYIEILAKPGHRGAKTPESPPDL